MIAIFLTFQFKPKMENYDGDVLHHRSKRFLYIANKTCGHIPYCSENINDHDTLPTTALYLDPRCSKNWILVTIGLDVILSLLITFSNFLIIVVITKSKVMSNCQGIFKKRLVCRVHFYIAGKDQST